jgi:hypothetical protein
VLILAAAIDQNCQYLVTLNERDFWPEPDLVQVIRPGDLIKIIRLHIDQIAR